MATRMRTISEAHAYIKEQDPQTAFTKTALWRMILSGEIPSITAGSKYLVNLDTLINHLENPSPAVPQFTVVKSGIRPVSEKICR